MMEIDRNSRLLCDRIIFKSGKGKFPNKLLASNFTGIQQIQTTQMKSKLIISLIGCTLSTLLTPTSLLAEIGTDLSDTDYFTKYGTSRRPQTCPSRTEPRTGQLTVAQAIKYTRCRIESENDFGLNFVNFVDFSNFQLSPPRHAYESEYIYSLDPNQPVYDFKAYTVTYHCNNIIGSGGSISQQGKNCAPVGADIPGPINSSGICFQDINKRRACRLRGIPLPTKTIWGPPPTK
jgi:hypothetical protein